MRSGGIPGFAFGLTAHKREKKWERENREREKKNGKAMKIHCAGLLIDRVH
jgi:hypothetical protein